jgi:hypothetical protein
VAHITATHTYAWAHPIAVKAVAVVVVEVHAVAVKWAAWCISVALHFSILMFFRVNAMLTCLTNELCMATFQMNFACSRFVLVHAAAAFGEVLLLGLAVCWLERAVSILCPPSLPK